MYNEFQEILDARRAVLIKWEVDKAKRRKDGGQGDAARALLQLAGMGGGVEGEVGVGAFHLQEEQHVDAAEIAAEAAVW